MGPSGGKRPFYGRFRSVDAQEKVKLFLIKFSDTGNYKLLF